MRKQTPMQNKNGVQKGPQKHAEGGHGSKTRSKILEQLHSGNGAHRLVEERQQHDDRKKKKKSEKTRSKR